MVICKNTKTQGDSLYRYAGSNEWEILRSALLGANLTACVIVLYEEAVHQLVIGTILTGRATIGTADSSD